VSYVFDACALLAYLNDEDGATLVDGMLTSGAPCYAHAVNLCEVYYDLRRRGMSGEGAWRGVGALRRAGVQPREDLDETFWRTVGELKTRGRVSLADCICTALANRLDAQVVTSDRREFTPLAEEGVCRVAFIR
jgi:PIN domain nuclease of toxin-antitoxin system